MKRPLFILVALLLFASITNGQEEASYGSTLGFTPQYTITSGLRVDIDLKTSGQSADWLIFSPQFYYNQDDNYHHSYEEMSGVGMDFLYRHYLNSSGMPSGLHFGFGFTFQYYQVKEYDKIMVEFEENGHTYFRYEDGLVDNDIFKLGPNIILGYQFVVHNKLYIDLYGGPGFRKSFDNREGTVAGYYDDWWGEIGYSGILLNGGVRVGIIL